MQNQTILITGGSSGIGLELAGQLTARNNKVIICGRSAERLQKAKERIPEVHTFTCDISKEEDRNRLVHYIIQHHPDCNVLINNAAIAHNTSFKDDMDILDKARQEIEINLFAPIALSKLFLPLLEKQKRGTIINITTGLVYAPRAVYPIYNATKAGLHSFTQVLRLQLNNTAIKVLEVLMPVVDTPWHKGTVPKIAISPLQAATEMIEQIEKGKSEIKVGAVKLLSVLSRIAPQLALKKINQI